MEKESTITPKSTEIKELPKIGVLRQIDQSLLPVSHMGYKVAVLKGYSTITQTTTYKNTASEICDVGFVYPRSIHSAFSNLRIYYGDKIIDGEIMKKEVAKQKFTESKEKGETAVLVEGVKRQRMMDTVYTRIGNIHPGMEITIEFSILQEVEQPSGGQWELKIPGELRPLYPVKFDDVASYCLKDSDLYNFFKDTFKGDGEKEEGVVLNKYKLQAGGYPWNIEVQIASNSEFFNCDSPTHDLVRLDVPIKGVQKFVLDPSKPQFVSKAFIFRFRDPEYKREQLTLTRWEENKTTPYAFNLFLDADLNNEELGDTGSWDSQKEENTLEGLKAEFLFVIDRSGSMWGKPIELAR